MPTQLRPCDRGSSWDLGLRGRGRPLFFKFWKLPQVVYACLLVQGCNGFGTAGFASAGMHCCYWQVTTQGTQCAFDHVATVVYFYYNFVSLEVVKGSMHTCLAQVSGLPLML